MNIAACQQSNAGAHSLTFSYLAPQAYYLTLFQGDTEPVSTTHRRCIQSLMLHFHSVHRPSRSSLWARFPSPGLILTPTHRLTAWPGLGPSPSPGRCLMSWGGSCSQLLSQPALHPCWRQWDRPWLVRPLYWLQWVALWLPVPQHCALTISEELNKQIIGTWYFLRGQPKAMHLAVLLLSNNEWT